MAPRFIESSFLFTDGEKVPDHEEGWARGEGRELYLWHVDGYDTFDGEFYPLASDIESQEAAELLARAAVRRLKQLQPDSSSGGQGVFGIQDRVFVIEPAGEIRRIQGVAS